MSDMDKEAVQSAYEDVRNDGTTTNWAFLRYEVNDIILDSIGSDYGEFLTKFTDDARAFGFARLAVGDEMSKRSKFVMITWIGSEVSPLKRAKVSLDKSVVTSVMQSFAVEIQTSEIDDLAQEHVIEAINKAGGANYGTGVRE